MLTIIRGIPGSGKTTLAEKIKSGSRGKMLSTNHYESDQWFVSFNNDKFDPKFLKTAHQWCFEVVKKSLLAGADTVVSNTFIKYNELKEYIDFCLENNIRYEILVCQGEYKNTHNVSKQTVEKMKRNFEFYPPQQIVKDNLPKNTNNKRFLDKRENVNNLQKAFIFDIDGTLALNTSNRNPFNETLVGLDVINKPVLMMLQALSHHFPSSKIIILSGRTDSSRELTERWLSKNDIRYDEMHMRESGDNRKDSIVKSDIFDELSKTYFIEFVVDDRKQVKRMWVEKNVFVFDVNQFDLEF